MACENNCITPRRYVSRDADLPRGHTRTKHPSRPVSQKNAGRGSSPDHTPRPKRLHLSPSSVNTRSEGRGSGPPFLSGVSGGSAPAVPGGPLGVARKPHPTHAASVGMFGGARMRSPRLWSLEGWSMALPGSRTYSLGGRS
ncbi:hypothetical protein ISCGN_020577 [Ixodes scapularis]